MGALDELLAAWRANPDSDSTVALATYLGVSGREELIREVGSNAETWHQADCAVMLAVGRMYLDAGLLPEAQAALVAAGKADARDGRAFRYLGEVLLRRGDATRAEKVLARAVQLGVGDSETRLWHERSVVYVALQKRVGPQAVATEVERTLPRKISIPPPTFGAGTGSYPGEEEETNPRAPPRSLTAPTPAVSAEGNTGRRPPPPPRRKSSPPPAPNRSSALPSFELEAPTTPGVSLALLEASAEPTQVDRPPPAWAPPPGLSYDGQRSALPPLSPPTPFGGLAAPAPLPSFGNSRAPAPPMGPGGTHAFASQPQPAAAHRARPDDPLNPPAELVLEHLARAGVYEPSGGAAPAWEAAARIKTRGTWVLGLAIVLLSAAGVGGYFYSQRVKEERYAQAAELNREVVMMLHSASVEELRASDGKLSQAFDLDSRSKDAAKLWLENRVLGALLLSDEPRGIDSAVHRALGLGVPEEEVAYGKVAAFLAEGDLAGAAGLLARWDARAGKDALFQLAGGAALERAGDSRAIERLEAARRLDPKLVAADILLARLALLELGPQKARPIIEQLKQKLPADRVEVRALSALAWAVDSDRVKDAPAAAEIPAAERDKLPSPLRAVPFIVEAVRAMEAGDHKRASLAIGEAISLSTTPSLAARLGFLAIQAGDEQLARRAALRALQFAAVYPGARVLAARVALLGGRLDEAKKAIEELDPRTPEILVVRSAVAYETFDASELASAVEAMGEDAKHRGELSALAVAGPVLAGRQRPGAEKLKEMSNPSVPWGELVAVDAALDSGDLALAESLVAAWGETTRPVYLLRVARLRRYQGKLDEAERASKAAFDQGTTTVRGFIERVMVLIAREDAPGARELLAKYPTLMGPMTAWLSAMVDVIAKRDADANVKVAQLDLPPDAAPLPLRVIVVRSLAAAGDRRAQNYLRAVLRGSTRHPDLIAASEALR
jgi:hypothetical protein